MYCTSKVRAQQPPQVSQPLLTGSVEGCPAASTTRAPLLLKLRLYWFQNQVCATCCTPLNRPPSTVADPPASANLRLSFRSLKVLPRSSSEVLNSVPLKKALLPLLPLSAGNSAMKRPELLLRRKRSSSVQPWPRSRRVSSPMAKLLTRSPSRVLVVTGLPFLSTVVSAGRPEVRKKAWRGSMPATVRIWPFTTCTGTGINEGVRSSSALRYSDTRSSTWIQGRYWSPPATGPPTPSLNGGSIFSSAPPFLSRTTPVRMWTTRRPSSAAAAASRSQATHTPARKSDPGGVDSGSGSEPCLP